MSNLWRIVRKLLGQPDFVLAFAILGISAIGLNVCTDYLKLHYRKQAVPLRVAALGSDAGIPATLGKWVLVSRDKPLDPDIEHILGTDKYIFRQYVNSEVIGESRIHQLLEMSAEDRDKALGNIQTEFPNAVVHVGLTYYTGMVDTVAHIPDRCFLADGFEVTNYDTMSKRALGNYSDGSPRVLDYRLINFEDQSGRGRIPRNVAYFFNVNGNYVSDPLGVRRSLQNLFERYGYYAKVELMASGTLPGPGETANQARERSTAAMEDLLVRLLPEVERCLPDWAALHPPGAK
ncbi:MAG TPA: hypothetical protein VIM11_00925 [Tepidisphaeraceae bacterium]